MDRAMAHKETTTNLKWFRNVPWAAVHPGFIKQLRERNFEPDEFYQIDLPWDFYWNIYAVDDNDYDAVFVYGTYCNLEKDMRIVRVSIRPDLFRLDGVLLSEISEQIKMYGQDLGMKRIFFETDKWKSILRKLDGLVHLTDSRVILLY